MRYTGMLLQIAFLFLAGCTVSKTICPCEAPEIIRLGDKQVEINARVFLTDTTATRKMKVTIWLATTDETPLPSHFNADSYYLRSANLSREAFEGKLLVLKTDSAKGKMELETIDAPLWLKGELVDVAVHIVDSHGNVHFIKKDALPVKALED